MSLRDHGCGAVGSVEWSVAVLLALLLIIATGHASVDAQRRRLPPGAAILGQVVDAHTGRGLDRTILELEGAGMRQRLVTDNRGRFLFSGLPTGEYRVTADRAGYLRGAFGQRRPSGAAATIALIDGQWVAGAEVAMWRPAVISGSVRDDRNDPVVGLTVRAYRRDEQPGHTTLREVAHAMTDDTGTYRLSGLVPGAHVIGLSHQRLTLPIVDPAADTVAATETAEPLLLDISIAPQYYPGADSLAAAVTVRVDAGREMTGIGFMVPVRPPLTISGRLDPASVPQETLTSVRMLLTTPRDARVSEAPGHRMLAETVPNPDGRFEFTMVPPGDYTIEAVIEGGWAHEAVTLTNNDITDIVMAVRPAIEVEGQGRAGLQLHFEPLFEAPGVKEVTARIEADGHFRTGPTLSPGRYQVRVSGLPQGQVLLRVVSGGTDVADAGLDLSMGFGPTDVAVELTSRVATLGGTVRGSGAFGDPSATVLLFPDSPAGVSTRRLRSVRVRTNGTFFLPNLLPGRYRIVAIDEADAEGWMAQDRLRSLRTRGMLVDLRDGEAKVVELRRQRE